MARNYDYIVVGAGSAGCVVASRLTEDPKISVLILEAGGRDSHPWLHMPLGNRQVIRSGRFNWNYESEPEPSLNNRRLPMPRGKVLGGTSSINAMVYARGHRTDYDQWQQNGLEGWSFDDVLPYFKRAETNWRGENKHHGGSGPLRVSHGNTSYLLFEQLRAAVIAAGHPETDDPHGDHPGGICAEELTIGDGRRCSTAVAYLHPAMARSNLTVEMRALTTRVLIEKGRAVGVEYSRDGQLHQVRCDREVILSGGAYNSPQLLLLSGIGPADELKALGIAPVLDLPGVGRNLSEHPFTRMTYEAARPVTFINQLRLDRAVRSVLRWALFGSGPFATQVSSRVFLRTRPGLDRPDIVLVFYPIHFDANLWFPLVTKPPLHLFTCGICVLHPESRGRMTLRSANPADPPRIQLNIYSAHSDMDTMIRGLRAARQIYAKEPLAKLISREFAPGAAAVSDDDIAAFVRTAGGIAHHPVGTCRMGTDPDAVVDAKLRVRGIDRLRVADASVMPAVPGGNTNAPAIMIGEKAADMILGRSIPVSAAA